MEFAENILTSIMVVIILAICCVCLNLYTMQVNTPVSSIVVVFALIYSIEIL